jgi:hypothetical protein
MDRQFTRMKASAHCLTNHLFGIPSLMDAARARRKRRGIVRDDEVAVAEILGEVSTPRANDAALCIDDEQLRVERPQVAARAYETDGVSTSWIKIKNPTYSQMAGRCELFEQRRDRRWSSRRGSRGPRRITHAATNARA